MTFTHDAFISYSHEDRPWAQRIRTELQNRGLNVFLDEQTLRAGEVWEESLFDALSASQHLIILSSRESQTSSWVTQEVAAFRALARGPADSPRRIIPVILDEELAILRGNIQAVREIFEARGYASGPDALADQVWEAVLDRLRESIGSADAARPIPVLVVTTTEPALREGAERPIVTPVGDRVTLKEFAESINVDLDALLDRYGDSRSEWRPFGSDRSVREILDVIKDELNRELVHAGLERVRWEYLDSDFWSGSPQGVAQRLAHDACLVLLDPVALYDEAVQARTRALLFPKIRGNDRAVVVVLPPFAMPPTVSAVRNAISFLAQEILDAYHNPPVFSERRYARYVPSVGDVLDLRASLLIGLGPFLASELANRNENPFTGLGRR